MAISIDLPEDLERSLRRSVSDLDTAAKVALLVDLYRQRKLTRALLAETLGLTRIETDGLLKQHEVYLEVSADEVLRESDELGRHRDRDADRR